MNDLYKNYDEKEHAKCLLKILVMDNPCGNCPLQYTDFYIRWEDDPYRRLERISYHSHCCSVCRVFINMNKIIGDEACNNKCPCYVLGKAEAIKRTWIALEEKGYI